MKKRKDSRTLLIGTLVIGVSMTTAWAVGRPGTTPATPMEEALAAAEPVASASAMGGAQWDLPVTRNESVDTWIKFLAGRNQDKTKLWMERSGKYTPMIRAELRRRGMPEDLIYLAFIESGYQPKAESHAAAVGLWQFIAETGKRYGLSVTPYVDERRDPIESTSAALDYLQELYDRFGSWYLAAASYNTGENRVARIMRETTGSERGKDEDFWRIADRLPRETRNYVPLMLAAGHIGKEPEKYGFTGVEYQDPMAFKSVVVPPSVELSTIAKAAGVETEAIEDLNPHLLRGITPPDRDFVVRVPLGTEVRFAQTFQTVLAADRAIAKAKPKVVLASTGKTHRVRRGETLSHIAKRYGVSVRSITQANGGLMPARLQIGQTVRIPGGGSVAKASSTASKRYHSVRRGENLSVIAKRYRVSVTKLKSLNGMRGSTIRPGQKLRVT